jgi:hypothetical protein
LAALSRSQETRRRRRQGCGDPPPQAASNGAKALISADTSTAEREADIVPSYYGGKPVPGPSRRTRGHLIRQWEWMSVVFPAR